MSWQAWVTATTLVLMLASMASGRVAADFAVLGALLVLVLTGVISASDAASGFASPALVTIALLYVVATGLKETGAMASLCAWLLGRPRSPLEAQARLIGPVALLSAFTNNTPLVAAFLPVINGVSKRTGVPPSRLYMPLSFAAILGGLCTLIGTSTNLTVAALIERHNAAHPADAVPELGLWTQTPVGLVVAVVGLVYILLLGRTLLPDDSSRLSTDPSSARRYMTAMRIETAAPIVGLSVESAGLRHLPGLFLSRIDRPGESITAVEPTQRLSAGDVLVFVGILDSVIDLQRTRGLTPVTDESGPTADRPAMRLVEAVISPDSPLIGQTIREAGLRTRYGAVVIAVHRLGHRLQGKIGDIVVKPGDTLLLEAGSSFAARYRNSEEFHLVSELEGAAAPRHSRAWLAMLIMVSVIVLLSIDSVEPMTAALAAAAAMIAGRCCTGAQARSGLDLAVLIVVGAAAGLGEAMRSTGLAALLAESMTAGALGFGPVAVLSAVYALTTIFTMLMSNNAAAAVMFPVALATAQAASINPLPLVICVTIAASAEFMTPFGYQTNLMVMGPGGYQWKHFLRFGGPLTVLCGVAAVAASSMMYGPLAAR